MSGAGRWSDLGARVLSAIAMVGLGGAATWYGGGAFVLLVAASCGLMAWELLRMLAPGTPRVALALGWLVALALGVALGQPPYLALAVLLVPVLLTAALAPRHRGVAAAYMTLIVLAGYSLIGLRLAMGIAPVLWLIGIVVASDVAGYFAGKAIGGARLWPRVSPKKTWSGTVAGWLAAALLGVTISWLYGFPLWGIPLAVVLAMAAQAGDIAESAIKRRAGVKDSSTLIPGHGGLMDRFDGLLGAALLLALLLLASGSR
jgi:phosphatidate cytidylyltransferase